MILIITKALCYHQVYIADDLYKIYGDSFTFVQMREPLDWRVKNQQEGFERPYLITFNKKTRKQVINLIKHTDVLIYGEAPLKLIRHRNNKCLLFRMSENIFKDTQFKISLFGKIKRFFAYKYLKMLTNNNNSYLLACSAFAYNDYLKLGIFKDRALKWGYFPSLPFVSIDNIKKKFDEDSVIELVWVSRLVEYKQPLLLLDLVNYLLESQITNFHISVVGNSDESDFDYFKQMTDIINEKQYGQYITMVGKVSANEVSSFYTRAHIALFTADNSEGWSVGINEAMSCGCAVVSSNGIGAAPYLINKKNGVIFQYTSSIDFCEKTKHLVCNKDVIKSLALNGFETIHNIWNHEYAANSLSSVIDNFLENKSMNQKAFGPCSIASETNLNWYKE